MLRFRNFSTVLIVALSIVASWSIVDPASACTNILVSKGASADGSVMITYNDGYVAGKGEEVERGYPEGWLRNVIGARPEQFLLEQREDAKNQLPY